MIWMKFLHMATIAIWSAGLICLPGLYVRRGALAGGEHLHRLQAMTRHLYVAIMSPAAFLAIASGTALIFMQETFEVWFSLKLALVGVMTTIHILTGLVIIRLFAEGEIYPVWRFTAVTTLTVLVIAAILFLVLGKPEIAMALPDWTAEPGALRRLVLDLIPYPR